MTTGYRNGEDSVDPGMDLGGIVGMKVFFQWVPKKRCEEKLELGRIVNMFKNFCWKEKARSMAVLEIKYSMGTRKGEDSFS